MLRRRIAAAFPDDGILGEEQPERPGRSGWRWVLDPIDGTRAFVRGLPHWSTLVAVERAGRSRIGVAIFPALGEEVYALRGAGAFWRASGRTRRARVSATKDLSRAFVETQPGTSYRRGRLWAVHERLSRDVASTRGWSDAYAFALVATGRADAALVFGVKRWDIAPFDPILREAGGRFSDWTGVSRLDSDRVLASNGLLHAALVARLR